MNSYSRQVLPVGHTDQDRQQTAWPNFVRWVLGRLFHTFVFLGAFIGFGVHHSVAVERNQNHLVLNDFESVEQIAGKTTTHAAIVTLEKAAPKGVGQHSMKTSVESDSEADRYFGAGCRTSEMDLTAMSAIRFWIKTDIQSDFNLQIHSNQNRASVFRFSSRDWKPGEWKQISAPLKSFTQPPWSDGAADLERVNRWQITAFGSGPYDGKFILLDDLIADTSVPLDAPEKRSASTKKERPLELGGPIRLSTKESEQPAKSPPEGFRRLFDGKSLRGWKPMARIPVAPYPGAPLKWRLEGKQLEAALKNKGRWIIQDGAIVGGQEPPGSGKGAYLVSEETFGDFELLMDMKPDWKTDSGFLVRTLPDGSPGIQILVDHRPQGGIGGFYGNGVAGIHGMPFAIDAEYDEQGYPIRMIAADPNDQRVELNPKTRAILQHHADVEAFLRVWKWSQWNTIKVRCEGRIPTLTTWVNGLKIAVLNMNDLEWENYDKEACAEMLGREGHISLEVHNNNFNHWLGKDRWWPGAVVRWKNIFIRELD